MESDAQISQQILQKYKSLLEKQQQTSLQQPAVDSVPDIEVRSSPAIALPNLLASDSEPQTKSVVHGTPHVAPYSPLQNGLDTPLMKQQMHQHYTRQIDQLQQDHQKLTDNLKRVHAEQLRQLEKERDMTLSQSRNTISLLNQKVHQQEQMIQEKQQTQQMQQQDVLNIKALYEQKVAELQLRVQNLEGHNAELSNQLQTANQHLQEAKIDFQATTKQQGQLQQQNYQAQLALYQNQNKQLQSKLSEQQIAHQDLIQQAVNDMKNLNSIVEQLQSKIEKLRMERDVLRQKTTILSSETQRTKEELARVAPELESLRNRNQTLVKELLKCDKIIYGRK